MIGSAQKIEAGTVLQPDVCIVGAGAAGITLALALKDTGLRILLLESGSDLPHKATQALYEGEVADVRMHSQPVFYRQRRFGGSTTIWGGRCVPLDPQDFEKRDCVPDSGWPISYADVARFYPAATELCEAGSGGYRVEEAFPDGLPPLFGAELPAPMITDGLERFSCPTDFGARYRARLSNAKNVQVLFHANCGHIALGPDGNRVETVHVSRLDGTQFSVRPGALVLAVGGLETPRLLLASRDVHTEGIGNAHDLVGRYYMCHLAGSVGDLLLEGSPHKVRHGYEMTPDGIFCRRRLALNAFAQKDLGVANLVARLHFPAVSDPSHGNSVLSGIFLARLFLSHEYSRRLSNRMESSFRLYANHIWNVMRYPHDAFGFLAHWVVHHNLAQRRFPSVILKNRSNRFSLEINAEQIPLANSRVTITREKDALGMPRLHVDWRYARADIESVMRTLTAFSDTFARSGLGSFRFDPERIEHDLTCFGAYGGHHIGTARMGNDPRRSVVDADCRIHGISNFFIAGSAVFPTSGQANPTLTLVALSMRLAETLAQTLGAGKLDATSAVK